MRNTRATKKFLMADARATRMSRSSITTPPNPWRPDFTRIQGRIAQGIADQIEEAIRSGLFQPGDQLPTQQAIADALGFHLNTVYAAYREAARRGLTRGFARRGTFVIGRPTHRPGDTSADAGRASAVAAGPATAVDGGVRLRARQGRGPASAGRRR